MFIFFYLKFKGDDWELVVVCQSYFQRLLNFMFINSDLSELS